MHETDLIRHAVRKIAGGPELVEKWQQQKTGFRERLPDFRDDSNDDPVHFWN